ncbi:MAG TPA: DUF5693 family protein [Candidatus Ozemobacteraceae bacterium]|nr:DUF5693 family protein [Candidatus Ozemobacteraceae bacterium]
MIRGTRSWVILLILCIPGLLAAVWRDTLRWKAESRDVYVETVMDFDELRTLAREEGWKLREMLLAAVERGASSVGISEDTLRSLETEGRVAILNLADLRQMAVEGDTASCGIELAEPQGALWIWSQEKGLLDRIEHHLSWKLPAGRIRRASLHLLVLRRSGEDFKTRVGLGFSKEYIDLARECGLGVVLRIYNHPGLSAGSIRAMIAGLPDPTGISAIVFAEEEVLGNRGALHATVDELLHRSFRIGWVEFNDQAGMETLIAGLRGLRPFVRVHSIGRKELDENYNVSRAIARWVRAVRERRLKMLYMRCFFQDKKKFIGDLVQFNLEYLGSLVRRLEADGFRIPRNDEQRREEPRHLVGAASTGERLAIGLVLMMGIPLLVAASRGRALLERDVWLTVFATFLAWGLLPPGAFVGLAGLAGAVAWPSLGCIRAMVLHERELDGPEPPPVIGSGARFFLRLVVPGIIGGTLIAALYAETTYLLKFEQFRGIKAAFLLPLVWTGIWALRRYGGGMLSLLSRPLTARELLIGLAVAGGTVLYLLRSGNVTFLKPSEMEDLGRTFLENLMIARPRNKEFLIGYPAALFFLFFRRRGVFEILPVLALFMQMGQVSLVNTFCHFHSPLALAYLRGFNGLWTGLATGVALLAGYLVCRVLALAGGKGDRSLLVGYFGFGNLGDELLWRTFTEEAARRRPDLPWSILWGPNPWNGPREIVPVLRDDRLGVLEALASSRAIVVPGGSLLQASTSLGSLLYYLLLLATGRLLGAKLILIGQGFGPWGTPDSGYRLLAAMAVRGVLEFGDHISCRDREAALVLERLPGPPLCPAAGADLVFLKAPAAVPTGEPPARVGVVLRGSCPEAHLIAERLGAWGRSAGYIILPIAFQEGEDERPWKNIQEYSEVTILRDAASAETVFAGCRLVVTMRLHAAVLASIAGTPWLGLAVDPKMTGLAAELGWEFVLPPEEADTTRLEEMIRRLVEGRQALSAALRNAAAGRAAVAAADLDRALVRIRKLPA